MRYSRQREVILKILRGTRVHPSADWVYREARKVMPNISLGTVYRNLSLLADQKEIITLETEEGTLRYDGDISQHSHFVCNNCRTMYDLDLKTPVQEVVDKGFFVESYKLMLYGFCPECSKRF